MLTALYQFAQSMGAPREFIADLAGSALRTFLGGFLLLTVLRIAGRFLRRASMAPARMNQSSGPRIEREWSVHRGLLQTVGTNELGRWRLAIFVAAPICSAYVWANTYGNHIETSTILIWLLSIVLWAFAFAPLRWNFFDWATDRVDILRRVRWRQNRLLLLALALIMLLGFNLRFTDLDSSPPQMISDHVENVKDAHSIRHNNYRPILFTQYSAREPLHYYLLVALSWLPGQEVDRYAFSLLSAIEGLLTLPLIFWLALELMGRRDQRFGQVYGLIVTALVAVSLWHITMSRQGFRITLCPLLMTWSLIFYTRALRYNHRTDYVKAGLLLGFGLISYQPMQMLSVIYIVGIAIALLAKRHSWRAGLGYAVNFALLVFTAFVVFLPLFHVWVEYPGLGLMRQTQSIFGDALMSTEERLGFLSQNGVPALLSNFRLTALMFHHSSDFVWISAIHNEPAADPLTATFILLGTAAWLTLMFRRRDPAILLVPAALILMLVVPSLALAHPNYSPHYMRALGSLCPIFLIAAFPLALFCKEIHRTFPRPLGVIIAASVAASAILYAYDYSSRMYFERYTKHYLLRAQPHRQAGAVLRGFAESDGSYGNAFSLPYPHWWDNRAVGMEAGSPEWFNAIEEVEQLPEYLRRASERQDELRLDPNRDLLFFYSQNNHDAALRLRRWFPQGRPMRHDLELESKSFYSYRVPALGWEGLHEFLDDNA
ncbi:MAG: hypothetical protein OXG78_17540 [Chloroflexi bacterium]|nr:hypothetical protein [Chloroflexota bacterium]